MRLFIFGLLNVQFLKHTFVKSLLGLLAFGKRLVVVVQACPMLCKFFITAAFYLGEKVYRTLSYSSALLQTFSWILAIDSAFHEGFVLFLTIASIVMCSSHKHG